MWFRLFHVYYNWNILLPLKLILHKDTNPFPNATNLYTSVRQIIFEFCFFLLGYASKNKYDFYSGPYFYSRAIVSCISTRAPIVVPAPTAGILPSSAM